MAGDLVEAPIMYKYMQRCYAEKFVSGEAVLIQTLRDFESAELHSDGILDQGESIRRYSNTSGITRVLPGENWEIYSFLRNMGVDARGLVYQGRGTAVAASIPNMHIFSLSEVRDDSVVRRISSDYDCCFEIRDPNTLLAALFDALVISYMGKDVHFERALLGQVRYRNMEFSESNSGFSLNPFEKDTAFDYQHEARLVFLSNSDKVTRRKLKFDSSRIQATIHDVD